MKLPLMATDPNLPVSNAEHLAKPEDVKRITEGDDTTASVLVAARESPFFGGLGTTYVRLAVESGDLDQQSGRDWMESFEASSAAGIAFAS